MDEGHRGAGWFRELMEKQLIVVSRGGVRAALGADEQTALQGSRPWHSCSLLSPSLFGTQLHLQ